MEQLQAMADLLPAPTGGSGGPPHGMTSQFRGVTYSKKSAKWQAAINMGGRHVHLGTHVTQEEAAVAFDKAALIVRGDKAKINFPIQNYQDAYGNLLVDEAINTKLHIAQTTEKGTGGGASRKRRLEAAQAAAAGGYGVDGDDAAAAFFNQSLLMSGFQGQGLGGDYGLGQLGGRQGARGRAGASAAAANPWPPMQTIMSACLPPGARLREMVPHNASRIMGVLYDHEVEVPPPPPAEGESAEPPAQPTVATQVGLALWYGGIVLSRSNYPDDVQARAQMQLQIEMIAPVIVGQSGGAGTPGAGAAGGLGQAQGLDTSWQQQQQNNLLLSALMGSIAGGAGAPGAAGGWPGALPSGLPGGTPGADDAASQEQLTAALAAAMNAGADTAALTNLLAAAAGANPGDVGGFPALQGAGGLAGAPGAGGGAPGAASNLDIFALLTATMGLGGDPNGNVAAAAASLGGMFGLDAATTAAALAGIMPGGADAQQLAAAGLVSAAPLEMGMLQAAGDGSGTVPGAEQQEGVEGGGLEAQAVGGEQQQQGAEGAAAGEAGVQQGMDGMQGMDASTAAAAVDAATMAAAVAAAAAAAVDPAAVAAAAAGLEGGMAMQGGEMTQAAAQAEALRVLAAMQMPVPPPEDPAAATAEAAGAAGAPAGLELPEALPLFTGGAAPPS